LTQQDFCILFVQAAVTLRKRPRNHRPNRRKTSCCELSELTDPNVPKRWESALTLLSEARNASRIMTDSSMSAPVRDEATRRYVEATDALVAAMLDLRQAGVTDRIADFLWHAYGPPKR
jgi:hypothetical protein